MNSNKLSSFAKWQLTPFNPHNKAIQEEQPISKATDIICSIIVNKLENYIGSNRSEKFAINPQEVPDLNDIFNNTLHSIVVIVSRPSNRYPDPVIVEGDIGKLNNDKKMCIIFIDILLQPDTTISQDIIDIIGEQAPMTVRHELQHWFKYSDKTEDIIDAKSSLDSESVVSYLLDPEELDAWISSIVDTAVKSISSENLVNIDKYLSELMWLAKSTLTRSGLPSDVINHAVSKIKRSYLYAISSKYNVPSILSLASIFAAYLEK
jgi:hypothetical protein